MKYKSREEHVREKREKRNSYCITWNMIDIPTILFETSIKLQSTGEPFYKFRKVVKNRTKDRKVKASKTRSVESKE